MVVRDLTPALRAAAKRFPCLTITGPRQSGKSTLCKAAFPRLAHANLEAPDVRSFALQDPRGFLNQFSKGAILDEIQRCPDLPSYLQERIDADPRPGRWVLTGSQNLALMSSVSQSLAGRTAILHLLPLAYPEVCRFRPAPKSLDEVLFAGGYPRIFDQRIPPREWLGSYVSTYLERDVRGLLRVGDLTAFQRFLGLCAGRTAQLLNLSSLASDCGVSQPTAAAWVSVLEASFIVFRLPYYSRGIKKRLVKMPKLHFHDTGLVCWLLGIQGPEQLQSHPLRGGIFETWVVSEIVKHRLNRGVANGLSYYRDAHGLEADLLIDEGSNSIVVEAKAGQTVDQGMFAAALRVCSAVASHGDARPYLVFGGDSRQARAEVTVVPWRRLHQEAWGIVKAARGRTGKQPGKRQGGHTNTGPAIARPTRR